jgi:hypothetical protein
MNTRANNIDVKFFPDTPGEVPLRGLQPPRPLPEPGPDPEFGMAISLCTVTFAGSQGVAISQNGVVTPNHPDMVWLVQPAIAPAPLKKASRGPGVGRALSLAY